MIRALLLVPLLAACNLDIGSGGGMPSASDFVDAPIAVTPGLASCATAIGRPDLAVDPDAPMSEAEIEGLLACTSARAQE